MERGASSEKCGDRVGFRYMNHVRFVVLFGLLSLGAGCVLSPPTSGIDPSVTDPAVAGWQTIDTEGFTLLLPPGWTFHRRQGMDSSVGDFVGDGVALSFDYGQYSNPLPSDDDATHTVTYEDIDGHRAKIVVPKVVGDGTTGVHFADVNDIRQGIRLTIYSDGLNTLQQENALKIFRTVKF